MKPKFMTFSNGVTVDLNSFDGDEVGIEELALSLARVNRFAGHTKKGVTYSVAEHSVWVSLNVPYRLALPALMHDIEEAVFGDIPTPAKHLAPAVIEAGDKIRQAIWRSHGVTCTASEWEYVKEADHLALIAEARDFMHPNITRYVPFDRDIYIPQIVPVMNEDDIVEIFLHRYHELQSDLKRSRSFAGVV